MFTMVHFSMFEVKRLSPNRTYMLSWSIFDWKTYKVDMKKIILCNELCLDMWVGVGVFGPMSLHLLPWDALLG